MRTSLIRPAAALAATFIVLGVPATTDMSARQSGGSITIDFRALAADGQPVTNLEPAEVALKVDGRPREIRSLRVVRAGAGSSSAAAALPAPFASNTGSSSGRDVVLLVDEESVTPGREQPLRDALGYMIGALTPGDRLRLVSARQGGINIGPTTDHAAVKGALPSIQGHGSARETATDLECRTSRLLGTLESVFTMAGRTWPATIVFFSASVAALKAGQVTQIGQETGTGLCQLRMDHFRQLGTVAQTARPQFFVVETLEVGGTQMLPSAAGGLENIAGAMGGEFLRLGGAAEAQMTRIAKQTSAYYLATFEPEASERSGSNRRVEVSVSRGGVSVRARQELVIPKAGARRSTSPRDMIRTADAFTDLPLRASSFASRNKGDDKIKVVTVFETAEPGTKLNAAMIGLFDEKGTLRGQWTAQSSELAQPTITAAVAVPSGKYRLRVAATDSSGRSGAVDAEIVAVLITAGPIVLSDLAFGAAGTSGLTPVLQFRDQPNAIAFLELYGRPAGQLGARIELAQSPDGPVITAVPVSASASDEPDRFTLSGTIPLDKVQPGDYVVRALIGVQGQPEGRVLRTLRKLGSGS